MSGAFRAFVAEGVSSACSSNAPSGAKRARKAFLMAIALTGAFCVSAKAGYQVQVLANNGEASWEYNRGTTGGSGTATPGGTSSGTTDTTGLATNAVADSSDTIQDLLSGPVTSTEHGDSNLATGTENASEFDTGKSQTAFGSDGGNGEGDFSDLLHFTVQGATSATHTPITVTWTETGHMQGSGSDPFQPAATGFGPLAGLSSSVTLGGSAQVNMSLDATQNNDATGYVSGSNAGGGNFSSLTASSVVWTDVFDLVGATEDVPVDMTLQLNGHAGADSSYTSSVSLALPAGVSFTSDSGVFLSQVPEPTSFATIGILGSLLLRRRKAMR